LGWRLSTSLLLGLQKKVLACECGRPLDFNLDPRGANEKHTQCNGDPKLKEMSAELEALININTALQHGEHAEAAQHRNSYKQPEKYKTMQNITEQRLLGS